MAPRAGEPIALRSLSRDTSVTFGTIEVIRDFDYVVVFVGGPFRI